MWPEVCSSSNATGSGVCTQVVPRPPCDWADLQSDQNSLLEVIRIDFPGLYKALAPTLRSVPRWE